MMHRLIQVADELESVRKKSAVNDDGCRGVRFEHFREQRGRRKSQRRDRVRSEGELSDEKFYERSPRQTINGRTDRDRQTLYCSPIPSFMSNSTFDSRVRPARLSPVPRDLIRSASSALDI